MFTEKIYYRYYRAIPRGFRQYAKQEYGETFATRKAKRRNPPKKEVLNRIIREPQLYSRKYNRFDDFRISDIPADSHGGLTECHLEITDNGNNQTVIFIGRVKCSRKDNFCYKIGREMALKAAREEFNKWNGGWNGLTSRKQS